MHQDAHEFLNYLLNSIAEDVQKYQKKMSESTSVNGNGVTENGTNDHGAAGKISGKYIFIYHCSFISNRKNILTLFFFRF